MMPTVLFAIQDHARRRALHDAARAAGYRVHDAATLDEALKVVAEVHVDVAFLDAGLDVQGRLAEALRRRQATPRPRIVRLLAHGVRTAAPHAPWRPDASLRGEVPVETAMALLAMLAPMVVGSAPLA